MRETMSQQGGLKRQKQSIYGEIIFPWNQCDYEATTETSLKQHIKCKHEGVWYPCAQCNYQATIQENLKSHFQSTHE